MESAGRLLPLKAVIIYTTFSRASVYRHIKKGTFPLPIKISERRVAWRSEDIDAWVAHCAAAA